jgi:hypothetical protein
VLLGSARDKLNNSRVWLSGASFIVDETFPELDGSMKEHAREEVK